MHTHFSNGGQHNDITDCFSSYLLSSALFHLEQPYASNVLQSCLNFVAHSTVIKYLAHPTRKLFAFVCVCVCVCVCVHVHESVY